MSKVKQKIEASSRKNIAMCTNKNLTSKTLTSIHTLLEKGALGAGMYAPPRRASYPILEKRGLGVEIMAGLKKLTYTPPLEKGGLGGISFVSTLGLMNEKLVA